MYKYINKYFTLILILLFFGCSEKINNNDLYPTLSIPLYSGANNKKTYQDTKIYGKNINYQLNDLIDPNLIIDFYISELSKYNFNESKNGEILLSNDAYIVDGDWTSPPARYIKILENNERTLVFILTLKYTFNKIVNVNYLIHPYSNISIFQNFDETLSKKESEEFYLILSKYEETKGIINYKKALKENPNNKIITEYVKLVEQNQLMLENNYKKFRQSIK